MNAELIYIVEPIDMPALKTGRKDGEPDWVFAGQSRPAAERATVSSVAPIVAGVAAATPLLSLAPALLAAAVVVSPILAGRFMSKSEAKAELGDDGKIALEKFILNHAITIDMVKELGLRFPPGHPQVGVSYKLHPLASMATSRKENLYIPYEKYDSILMEEREAELLRLLVHLGATRVSITRTTSSLDDKVISAAVAASAKVSEVELAAKLSSNSSSSLADTREFVMQGKPWREGDVLERSQFAWVNFEPSWEALVVAREIGGCLKAGLEIRENTAFATNKALNANVKGILYGGKVSGETQHSLSEEKVYFVEAEFGGFYDPNTNH